MNVKPVQLTKTKFFVRLEGVKTPFIGTQAEVLQAVADHLAQDPSALVPAIVVVSQGDYFNVSMGYTPAGTEDRLTRVFERVAAADEKSAIAVARSLAKEQGLTKGLRGFPSFSAVRA